MRNKVILLLPDPHRPRTLNRAPCTVCGREIMRKGMGSHMRNMHQQ